LVRVGWGVGNADQGGFEHRMLHQGGLTSNGDT
jgi:hypothetical protein